MFVRVPGCASVIALRYMRNSTQPSVDLLVNQAIASERRQR
jgi:hypothetical protein